MPTLRQVQRRAVEKPDVIECCSCSNSVERDDSRLADGERYCEQCHDDNFYICTSCSESTHTDYSYFGHGEPYCEDCFYEIYENCTHCGETIDRDEVYWRDDEPYCSSCVPNDIGEMTYNLDTNRPPSCSREAESFKFPVRRLVGIEVECLFPEWNDTISNPKYWTSTNDGSISSGEEYEGIEMVSYPASGDLLLDSIDRLMSWSNSIEAVVNRSCGLHVHFNSLDLNAKQVSHVAIVYSYFEEILKGMMPNSRQDSNWCKDFPIPIRVMRQIPDEEHLIETYYDYMDSSPTAEKYNDARYCGLNIHSRYYHGSLEFRLHSGTLNKTKIVNWIQILNKIIDMGIKLEKYTEEEYDKWIKKTPIRHMVSTFGVELCDYINKRTSKFKGGRENE